MTAYPKYLLFVTGAILLLMALYSILINEPQMKEPAPRPVQTKKYGPYTISCVIDGDTVVLNTGDKVRMKGIDAPELHHPVIPAQRFGEEARDFLRNLAEGKQCYLEYDNYDSKDMYGRALAYISVNGTDLNAEMLLRGFAYLYTFKPFGKKEKYAAYEREAREKHRGLWNFDLKDGRILNLINRYEALNDAGKSKLDENFKELLDIYPAKGD